MRGPSQRLELRQWQRQTITPQVRQSIEMLQLSNLEVTDFITAKMEQNPLLEWRESSLGNGTSGNHLVEMKGGPRQPLYLRRSRAN
jgi:RNA polymerase sigma-54 factor